MMVLVFFGAVDILLRFIGVDQPATPRIVVRAIDVDISFPFMRPDQELFWSPIPGFRGEFLEKTVTINSVGLRGAEIHPWAQICWIADVFVAITSTRPYKMRDSIEAALEYLRQQAGTAFDKEMVACWNAMMR